MLKFGMVDPDSKVRAAATSACSALFRNLNEAVAAQASDQLEGLLVR
jgi:hypothetical protein